MFTTRLPDEAEEAPPLQATLQPTPSAPGLLAAENVVESGGTGILDMVVQSDVAVGGWVCYARDRESHNWVPVDEQLNDHRRRSTAIPGTPIGDPVPKRAYAPIA